MSPITHQILSHIRLLLPTSHHFLRPITTYYRHLSLASQILIIFHLLSLLDLYLLSPHIISHDLTSTLIKSIVLHFTISQCIGKPGAYNIHKRGEPEKCFARTDCSRDDSPVDLLECGVCGAQKWNILGDAATGYVMTQDGSKNCLKRDGAAASMIKCSLGYTSVSLEFASKGDIATMSGDGAKLVAAAAANDMAVVTNYLDAV
jgi:hypothetical protein